tara:strand:- start:205 stop:588 length:384 start_codon:yes stop_codon:yes gene_type:complete
MRAVLVTMLLIGINASLFIQDSHSRMLGDGKYYHECIYDSPKDEPGYKPKPKVFYSTGFLNKSFSIGSLELEDVTTSENFAQGMAYSTRTGESNRFTFNGHPNYTLFIENLDSSGRVTFIARYICSK